MLQYAVALALTQGSRKAAETIFSLGSKYLAVLDIPLLWSVNNCEMISCLVFNIHIASRFSFLPMDWFFGDLHPKQWWCCESWKHFFYASIRCGAHSRFWQKRKKRLILHLSALAIASFFVSCCRKLHWRPAPMWLNPNWIIRLSENTFCWSSERRVSEGDGGF